MAVGNPAPPRPRSLEPFSRLMTSSGDRLTAVRMAAPRSIGAKMTGPVCTMPSSTRAATFASDRSRRTISGTSAGSMRVTTAPSTSADGGWSLMPRQDVYPSVIAPSGLVSPNRQPAARSKAAATAAMPCCFSTTALHSRTTCRPTGAREKKW